MVKYITSFPFILGACSWVFEAALAWLIFAQSQERFAKTRAQWALRAMCSISSAGILICLIDALIFVGLIVYRNWGEFEAPDFDLGQACTPTMSVGLCFLACLATMFATNLLSENSIQQANRSPSRPIGPGERFLLWLSSIANGTCAVALFCLAWVPAARLSGRLVLLVGFATLATWTLFLLSIPLHKAARSLVMSRDRLTDQLLRFRTDTKQQRR
jgi:hypothetical protein